MRKCWSINPEDRLSFDEVSIIRPLREFIFSAKIGDFQMSPDDNELLRLSRSS